MFKRIIEVRNNAGLNKSEFAKKLNISPSAITFIEKGEKDPSAKTLIKICETFNIDANWLLLGEGDMIKNRNKKEINYLNETENQIIESIIKQAIEREEKKKIEKIGNLSS